MLGSVAAKIMPPTPANNAHVLIPRNHENTTLRDKRDFVDVIK